jgi:hypothetical protein
MTPRLSPFRFVCILNGTFYSVARSPPKPVILQHNPVAHGLTNGEIMGVEIKRREHYSLHTTMNTTSLLLMLLIRLPTRNCMRNCTVLSQAGNEVAT